MPIKIKAREINGENGVCVKAGNNTFTFEGIVEEPNGEKVKRSFEVEGVKSFYDAVNMVDFHYCGYFDKDSVPHLSEHDRNLIKEAINKARGIESEKTKILLKALDKLKCVEVSA